MPCCRATSRISPPTEMGQRQLTQLLHIAAAGIASWRTRTIAGDAVGGDHEIAAASPCSGLHPRHFPESRRFGGRSSTILGRQRQVHGHQAIPLRDRRSQALVPEDVAQSGITPSAPLCPSEARLWRRPSARPGGAQASAIRGARCWSLVSATAFQRGACAWSRVSATDIDSARTRRRHRPRRVPVAATSGSRRLEIAAHAVEVPYT
mmetsp:Transcript_29655/g.81170  ORF Transcript_29655/g.81170 Transcript_29655/m.81170 type:complete len:207 (-) Transcript_29655:7-627(-)